LVIIDECEVARAHGMKAYRDSTGVTPLILNLGIRRK
jgi:hypothetical protein